MALITGANRGIGSQTAKDLGRDGAILLLGARDLAKGEAAAERMHQEGFEAEAVHLDVTNPRTHQEVYDFIDRVFGRLDILVSNAGVLLRKSNRKRLRPKNWSAEHAFPGDSARNLRNEFLWYGRTHPKAASTDPPFAGWTHR